MSAPVTVRGASEGLGRRNLATPKSSTFTGGPTKTLSGLRSRWMMPWACASTSARRTSRVELQRARERQRTFREQRRERAPFQQLHRQVHRAAGQLAEVEDVDDVRVLDSLAARASTKSRAAASGLPISSGASTFSATRRPMRGCSARYTSPIAPSPNFRTTR